MKLAKRLIVPLSVAAFALLALLIPAAPASAHPAQVRAYAMTSHPFSDPIWYPFAVHSVMGCMWDSPGCPHSQIQANWSWDIKAQPGRNHQEVYAMGAGIVHILAQHQGCGGSDETRGNTLYVDHGGGVISMYSHLSDQFLVQDGDYVSARTPIAYAGNSGYKRCHENPELRFLAVLVKHDARKVPNGGLTGTYVQISRTYACRHGHKVMWPQHLPARPHGWARWHNVPLRTQIPHTPPSRSCIPAPATATMPHDATLSRGSKTGMAATWSRASSHYHVGTVRVILQEYHPSISKWLPVYIHTPSGTATRTYFPKLNPYHQFRAKIWFGNDVGWSRGSPWQQRGFPR